MSKEPERIFGVGTRDSVYHAKAIAASTAWQIEKNGVNDFEVSPRFDNNGLPKDAIEMQEGVAMNVTTSNNGQNTVPAVEQIRQVVQGERRGIPAIPTIKARFNPGIRIGIDRVPF